MIFESSSYLTLASEGYIIHNRPKARGSEKVSICNLSKMLETSEDTAPMPTQTAIAKNIQMVRNLSNKCNLLPSSEGTSLTVEVRKNLYGKMDNYI